jgi:hypothetical protein
MGCANKSLPDFLFYHLRNLALLPCGAKYPSMDLPEHMRREIQDRFRAEVEKLRALAGLVLSSLGDD